MLFSSSEMIVPRAARGFKGFERSFFRSGHGDEGTFVCATGTIQDAEYRDVMRKGEVAVWDPRTYEDADYGLDSDESFEPEDADLEYDDVSPDAPHIMTVLGSIEPEELGICLVHEHLLSDPVTSTADDTDQRLDREDFASEEIEAFVTRGGRAIVEQTTPDCGRNAAGLVRLAMKAPVHLIGVTGRSTDAVASRTEPAMDPEHLASAFVADLRTGMDGTRARAGLIATGSDHNRAVAGAAAAAHKATGAPIAMRADGGTTTQEHLNWLRQAGVDPARVIVGNLDSNLDLDAPADVARFGAFLAFDRVGTSKDVPDASRAEMIVRLIEAGFGGQLLLSHGHARRSDYIAYGGYPGITWIIERFMLDLMEAGADALAVRRILVENPAQALTIHPPVSGGIG